MASPSPRSAALHRILTQIGNPRSHGRTSLYRPNKASGPHDFTRNQRGRGSEAGGLCATNPLRALKKSRRYTAADYDEKRAPREEKNFIAS